MVFPLTVGRERSRAAAYEAARLQRPLGVLLQTQARNGAAGAGRPALGRHHRQRAALHHGAGWRAPRDLPGRAALSRAAVPRGLSVHGRARAAHSPSPAQTRPGHRRAGAGLKARAAEILALLPQVPDEVATSLQGIEGPARLADFIAGLMDIGAEEKQSLLETFDLKARLDKLLELLAHRIEVLKVSRDVAERTKGSLDDIQRKHLLREQMRTIQKELGEGEEGAAEIAELDKAITAAKMPEEVEKQARKELKRLERMPEGAGEYSMIRTYLDWLIELPWTAAIRSADRHRRGAAHSRRGPLRPREDQEAHSRVPRGAQAQSVGQEPDPVLCRAARRGQDLARAEHRQGDRAQVRAPEPGRRPRRGGDPRPPAHVHRIAARQRHPEPAQGGHAQLRADAGRSRQARRRRLSRRPGVGAARSARPRAELDVPRQLPRRAVRSVGRDVHLHRERARHDSRGRCATGWRSSSCRATPRRKSCRSRAATWSRASCRRPASRRSNARSATTR